MKEKDSKNQAYMVPALKKGLQIIEMFTADDRVLTMVDFAERLGVTPGSIYRTIATLTEMHYLKKVGKGSYELGPAVISNGFSYLSAREVIQVAAPYLLELRDQTSATCHLAIREGTDAVYVYRTRSPQRLVVNVPIGSRFICHSVAIGRALLLGLGDESLSKLFAGVALDGYAEQAPKTLLQLKDLLEKERKRGYSTNSSDHSTAIAAPVLNYAGQVVAAINVSEMDFVLEDADILASLTKGVMDTAAKISAELGG